jgi:NADPH-dependent glutamate synthase beta subunit-like oxidoreductase
MLEKLPVPFGLIRYGVAPDHCEIKQVTQDFSSLSSNPNFRFFGDISVVIFI